jgi:hypothetical protein
MDFMAFVLLFLEKGGEGYMGCVVIDIVRRRYDK